MLEVSRIFNYGVGFFSGTEFNVEPEAGLSGYCDYILTASPELDEICASVVTVVEAKNENIKGGLGQCIAEMVAAQRFNQQKGNEIESIYGVVTTGVIWKFLKLSNQVGFIDLSEYYIKEINKILANQRAIAQDNIYIQNNQVQGIYSLMYYNHNIHLLSPFPFAFPLPCLISKILNL